jgi:hypothetical protein
MRAEKRRVLYVWNAHQAYSCCGFIEGEIAFTPGTTKKSCARIIGNWNDHLKNHLHAVTTGIKIAFKSLYFRVAIFKVAICYNNLPFP